MGFFIAMFIFNLLIPVIMIVSGYFMFKHPPKDINGIVGYRTAMSGKNNETWAFAQSYCGKLWIKTGLILIIPAIIVKLPFIHSDTDTVGNMTLIIEIVELLCLLGSIYPVEKALKKNFDSDGNKRE